MSSSALTTERRFSVQKDASWIVVHQVADSHHRDVEQAFLKAVGRARNALDVERLSAVFESGDKHAAEALGPEVLAALSSELEDLVRPVLFTTLADAGTAVLRRPLVVRQAEGLRLAKGVGLAFDVTDPNALLWAQTQGAKLVSDIADKDAIRGIIVRAFEEGIPPARAASMIREQIGLTGLQASWVEDRYAAAIAKGLSAKEAQAGANAFARGLIRNRARTIANTETLKASCQGQSIAWQQAIKAGQLSGTEMKEWIVTPDDRLDEDICLPMDGQQVGLKAPFVTPQGDRISTPPAHPNCRCAQGLAAPRKAPEGGVAESVGPGEAFHKAFYYGKVPTSGRVGEALGELDAEFSRMVADFPKLAQAPKAPLRILDRRAISGNTWGLYEGGDYRISVAVKGRRFRSSLEVGKLRNWDVGHGSVDTFRHEFGHHFHFSVLGEWKEGAEKSLMAWDWQRIYDSQPYRVWEKTVSKYAATNHRELFAEAFSAYTHPDYIAGSLPREIEAYLERYVGKRVVTKGVEEAVAEEVAAIVEKAVPTPLPPAPPPPPVAPPGVVRVMTADDAIRIRLLRTEGKSLGEIAKEYSELLGKNIRPQYIQQIVSGKIWKNAGSAALQEVAK